MIHEIFAVVLHVLADLNLEHLLMRSIESYALRALEIVFDPVRSSVVLFKRDTLYNHGTMFVLSR